MYYPVCCTHIIHIQNDLPHDHQHVLALILDGKRFLLAFPEMCLNHVLQVYDYLTFIPHGTYLYKQYVPSNPPMATMLNARIMWASLLCTFLGHTEWVNAIVFSPNGSRLTSCSNDNTVRLWDAQTGRAIGDAMVGHTKWVNSVFFSPDAVVSQAAPVTTP
jgi:WD40 repeat protein